MKISALKTLGFCALVSMASAAPVQYTANGHWYDRIDGLITWNDAKLAATAAGGYLATVTSAGENIFITSNPQLGNTPDYLTNPPVNATSIPIQFNWLGGFVTSVGGPWQWVTGEAFAYNNWAPDEPNNAGDSQSVLNEQYLLFDHGFSADGKQWNDFFEVTAPGYIVEWESNPNAVPDTAATLPLLLCSALPLFLARARRTRTT